MIGWIILGTIWITVVFDALRDRGIQRQEEWLSWHCKKWAAVFPVWLLLLWLWYFYYVDVGYRTGGLILGGFIVLCSVSWRLAYHLWR